MSAIKCRAFPAGVTWSITRKNKHFVEKLEDIVGLYLNPPEHAIVMCVDEKSQIQALDRTQPGLPLKKGRCGKPLPIVPIRRGDLWLRVGVKPNAGAERIC